MANLQAVGNSTDRPRTINERVASAIADIAGSCYQIEGLLSRVEGVPPTAPGHAVESTAAAPLAPLGSNIGEFEEQAKRLSSLASRLQIIA